MTSDRHDRENSTDSSSPADDPGEERRYLIEYFDDPEIQDRLEKLGWGRPWGCPNPPRGGRDSNLGGRVKGRKNGRDEVAGGSAGERGEPRAVEETDSGGNNRGSTRSPRQQPG